MVFRRIARVLRASRAAAVVIASIAIALAITSPAAAEAVSKTPSRKSASERASGASGGAGAAKTETKTRGPASIGAPNRGQLRNGARLRPTKHMRIREGARTWGMPSLIRLLRRTATEVAKKHRGSTLLVGDLSAKRGGPIEGHTSHQSGRDVDIAFFVANSKGKPVPVKRFIPFDANGNGTDRTWARFDDARNWTLVEALLSDEEVTVRYIFVGQGLRARLLAYAAKKRVPKDLVARATAVLVSSKDSSEHDDHFHIRIACPPSTPLCAEESAARDGAPAAAAPKTAQPHAAAPRASSASPEGGGAGTQAASTTAGAGDASAGARPSTSTSVDSAPAPIRKDSAAPAP
jgi:penicillin-insensitive murein DD-endopeptidase